MKIIGTNGIHSHGEHGTDFALEILKRYYGYETVDVPHIKRSSISVYSDEIRESDARTLLNYVSDDDVIIAHSYGTVKVLEAFILGMKCDLVFFFGAACSSDRAPWWPMRNAACRRLYNIVNPDDNALKWGSRMKWLLRGHPFGKMGAEGYQGPPDYRVIDVPGQVKSDGWLKHNNHLLPSLAAHDWCAFIHDKISEGES